MCIYTFGLISPKLVNLYSGIIFHFPEHKFSITIIELLFLCETLFNYFWNDFSGCYILTSTNYHHLHLARVPTSKPLSPQKDTNFKQKFQSKTEIPENEVVQVEIDGVQKAIASRF